MSTLTPYMSPEESVRHINVAANSGKLYAHNRLWERFRGALEAAGYHGKCAAAATHRYIIRTEDNGTTRPLRYVVVAYEPRDASRTTVATLDTSEEAISVALALVAMDPDIQRLYTAVKK